MILITLKMPIKPEKTAEWLELAASYGKAVRAEPGNVFFEFSKSLETADEYVCIEGFRDDAAGKDHMRQAHVPDFMERAAYLVSARPKIIYVDAEEVTGFGEMGEITPK